MRGKKRSKKLFQLGRRGRDLRVSLWNVNPRNFSRGVSGEAIWKTAQNLGNKEKRGCEKGAEEG